MRGRSSSLAMFEDLIRALFGLKGRFVSRGPSGKIPANEPSAGRIQRRLSQIYDGTDLEPILNDPLSLPPFNKYLALVSVPKSASQGPIQPPIVSRRCPGR